MSYTRDGVLAGEDITLRVIFRDDEGNLVDPDAVPDVYIYDETFTTDDIQAEIDASTFTGDGPFVPTQISTGYYEYTYTVPLGSNEGVWHDLWVSEQGGVDSAEYFPFTVTTGQVVTLQVIGTNTLIVIELDESIADVDGVTLEEDTTLYFSTEYDPLYASVDLVRSEVGPWIDFIPDDTINLLIHWSSREVDVITPKHWKKLNSVGCGDELVWFENRKGKDANRYRFARTKFVIYDVAVRALMLPAAANSGRVSGSGGQKRLGDLMIQEGLGGLAGRGLTMEQIQEMRRLRDEWWRVVNAGGLIVPGQSLDPSFAVKGLGDPDRRKDGRQWESTEDFFYMQPTTNRKYRRFGRRKYRFLYGDR